MDSVTLVWTAPGDDGTIGTATQYEMRMSTSPIDLSTWGLATVVSGLPIPQPAGAREAFTVKGLASGATYYFALRAADKAGNWSDLSNVYSWTRATGSAPPAPGGLSATLEPGDVHVHWSAVLENDVAGYNVYRASNVAGPFAMLNGATVSANDYVDSSLPAGAPQLWYYVTTVGHNLAESVSSDTVTVVVDQSGGTPTTSWKLETGYPNPSRLANSVTLPIIVPNSGPAGGALIITDNAGHRVWQIALGTLSPGRQLLSWDGRNESGRQAAPGIYQVLVISGAERATSRLVRVP